MARLKKTRKPLHAVGDVVAGRRVLDVRVCLRSPAAHSPQPTVPARRGTAYYLLDCATHGPAWTCHPTAACYACWRAQPLRRAPRLPPVQGPTRMLLGTGDRDTECRHYEACLDEVSSSDHDYHCPTTCAHRDPVPHAYHVAVATLRRREP